LLDAAGADLNLSVATYGTPLSCALYNTPAMRELLDLGAAAGPHECDALMATVAHVARSGFTKPPDERTLLQSVLAFAEHPRTAVDAAVGWDPSAVNEATLPFVQKRMVHLVRVREIIRAVAWKRRKVLVALLMGRAR
jgi:hypothetical protein